MSELTEAEFQQQITDLAGLCGWLWVHFRPAQTSHGWRTPVSGPLGAGWPDLFLMRVKDRRMAFIECKREGAKVTAEQAWVHQMLLALGFGPWRFNRPGVTFDENWRVPRIEVHIWHPSDWDRIVEVLR